MQMHIMRWQFKAKSHTLIKLMFKAIELCLTQLLIFNNATIGTKIFIMSVAVSTWNPDFKVLRVCTYWKLFFNIDDACHCVTTGLVCLCVCVSVCTLPAVDFVQPQWKSWHFVAFLSRPVKEPDLRMTF